MLKSTLKEYFEFFFGHVFSYFRNIANGEILGIHLLLEDILMLFNDDDEKIFAASEPLKLLEKKEEIEEDYLADEVEKPVEKPVIEETVFVLSESMLNPLNKFSQALINYAKIRNFLITWKRLEVLKLDWIRRKLLIDSFQDAYVFSKAMYVLSFPHSI